MGQAMILVSLLPGSDWAVSPGSGWGLRSRGHRSLHPLGEGQCLGWNADILGMILVERAVEGGYSGIETFRVPYLELVPNQQDRTQRPGLGGQVAS